MTCDGRKSIRGSCKMQTYQQRAQVSVKTKYITGGSIVKTGVVHWHVYFVKLIHMSSLKFSIAKKYLTSIFIFDFVIKRLKFSFFNKCQRLHLLYVPTEHVIILHLSREFYNLSHERKLLSKSILFWFSSAVLLEKVSNNSFTLIILLLVLVRSWRNIIYLLNLPHRKYYEKPQLVSDTRGQKASGRHCWVRRDGTFGPEKWACDYNKYKLLDWRSLRRLWKNETHLYL